MRNSWRFFLVVVGLFSCALSPQSSFAMGAKLLKYETTSDSKQNWRTHHPRMVAALGYLEPQLVERYKDYFETKFRRHLHQISPRIRLDVIEKARGKEVVEALQDPHTIGFIFISHTYKTRGLDNSIALASDRNPLPMEILSAATPALRFASFLGCSGAGMMNAYEVEYQLNHLPGYHRFTTTKDKYLSASFLAVDNVKKALEKELKDLEQFSQKDLMGGIKPDKSRDGLLKIRIKDVHTGIEPRYVSVNNRIVGVIGADPEDSNENFEYKEFVFFVPSLAFQTEEPFHRIKIQSSELTPGVITDNYLIDSVTLMNPEKSFTKTYSPALRIGDEELISAPGPFLFKMPEEVRKRLNYFYRKNRNSTHRESHPERLSAEKTLLRTQIENERNEQLDSYLLKNGTHLLETTDPELKKQQLERYRQFIEKSWRLVERMDRNPDDWDRADFKGRFFVEHLEKSE